MPDLAQASAQALKEAGDYKFADGSYQEALKEYLAAKELLAPGDAQMLSIQDSLAAVYLKLRQAKECADCARMSLDADAGNIKVRARLARALAAVGNFIGALEVLEAAPEAHQSLDGVKIELEAAEKELAAADELLEAGDHKNALEKFCTLEGGVVFDCAALVARMGRCYLGLGEIHRVLHISSGLLRNDAADVAALVLRAEAQFQATNVDIDMEAWDEVAESAIKVVRQALSFDPEHKGAAQLRRRLRSHLDLVKEVRSAIRGNEYARAEDLLTGVLEASAGTSISPLASGRFAARCYAQRARVRLERSNFEGCISDCLAAIRLDCRLTAAYVVEAQALQKLERWDEAVPVLEALHEWNKDNDIFWKVEWAKFEVRRVRRPNYYEILGLNPTCKFAEVKKAYLKRSVEYHPDKMSRQFPDLDRAEVEVKFKMVVEAFEILGDTDKRGLYDKGYDAQGIREVLAVRKRFAGQAPCAQCGEDESGKFGSDARWYCLACWESYYRDRPDEDPNKDLKADVASVHGGAVSSTASPGLQQEGPSMASSPRVRNDADRPRVPTWPASEILPSWEDIERMRIADLKDVLRKMQVDAVGCLTKEDLRCTICRNLEQLHAERGSSDDMLAPPSLVPRGAPDRAPVNSTLPDRAHAGAPMDGEIRHSIHPGTVPPDTTRPNTHVQPQSGVAEDASRTGPPLRVAGQPDWSFSIAGSTSGEATNPNAGARPVLGVARDESCFGRGTGYVSTAAPAGRPKATAETARPAPVGGRPPAPPLSAATNPLAAKHMGPLLLGMPVEFEHVD